MSIEPDNGNEFDDHIGADVPSDFKTRVRVAAAKEGVSMAAFVRRALKHELERVEDAEE